MKVLFNWKGALRSTLHHPLIHARHVFSFFGPSFVLQSKQATMFPSLDAPATIGLTVIVPAYNEEERLPQMLKATVTFLEQRRCVFSHWIMTEYLAILMSFFNDYYFSFHEGSGERALAQRGCLASAPWSTRSLLSTTARVTGRRRWLSSGRKPTRASACGSLSFTATSARAALCGKVSLVYSII